MYCLKLAPKVKEAKPKTENSDPNVQKEPKAKDGAKKPQKAGKKSKTAVTDIIYKLVLCFVFVLFFLNGCYYLKVPQRKTPSMKRPSHRR